MSIDEQLHRIRHVALDMDGTIYLGGQLFPYTLCVLERFRKAGIGYSFLTNNPTKSVADYLSKLQAMGIEATEENMYTTSLVTIDYLKERLPNAKHLFVLGTQSMQEQFAKAGFTFAADDPNDRPDAVVVSFDMTLTYPRLCRAAWWIKQGLPYLATNPDRVCPTNEQTVLVDCGSICKCLEHATSRQPDVTFGKPDPNMLLGILKRHHLQAGEVAMVGDRIYTDIAMAQNAGTLGVLVLSGETTREVAESAANPPDIIADTLEEFANQLLATRI